VPTVIYIASCLYLKLVLYLLNINSKTRYSNPWITPRVYRNLQRYLKRWRFMMAHLNEQIDVYFKVHYRVSEYNLRTLPPRTTIIPDRQYHAIRRRRQHRARQACLQAITLTDSNHGQAMAMATSSTCPHRVHFDTDSYDILVDNCCSKSITNCLGDFITPPRSSRMIIKGLMGPLPPPRWVLSNGNFRMTLERYTLSHCQRPTTLKVWRPGSCHHNIGHRWLDRVKALNALHIMTA
jgi:hypothetical protein